ncbi:MAG TPA: protein kinase [Verrucomicrobiae bacterium]|jgi:serine/threonine protein kinase|nr:protein kinase [Verrucomicrobiae bacterium]
MLDPALLSQIGQIVPDYELLRRIGGGSYGEVFLARSKATGILRAAKIVWRHSFEDERPFQREFEGIQRFERVAREHPSQLSLFHIGRNDAEGCFYYVMELADDAQDRREAEFYTPRTLRAELAQGRLSAAQALEIGLILAEALGHLHKNGLIHRDVKPSNVIFVNGRPKLADIGLVTETSDTLSVVGTEGYLAPEGPGTPQADIFALGKLLYEAATGLDRREFPKLPEDLRSWPDAKQVFELNEVVLKACAREASQRYPTCEELRADLALLQQGKSVKQRRTRHVRLTMLKKTAVVLTVAAALAAGATFFWRQSQAMGPLKLDSAQYHAANSMAKFNAWKFEEAIKEAALAIQLDPGFLRAHGYYGWYLELARGDVAAAQREYKIAERINANDSVIQMVMSEPLIMAHKFDLAIKQLSKAARLDPRSAEIHERLSEAYESDQQYGNAIDEHVTAALLNNNDPKFLKEWQQKMHLALRENGPRGLWQAELEWQKQRSYVDPYQMAALEARLGNTNEVFSLLNQAHKEHNRQMINLLVDDHWSGYREDPRFKALLDAIGIRPLSAGIK